MFDASSDKEPNDMIDFLMLVIHVVAVPLAFIGAAALIIGTPMAWRWRTGK